MYEFYLSINEFVKSLSSDCSDYRVMVQVSAVFMEEDHLLMKILNLNTQALECSLWFEPHSYFNIVLSRGFSYLLLQRQNLTLAANLVLYLILTDCHFQRRAKIQQDLKGGAKQFDYFH